jgi:hypothetical protein
MTNINPRSTCKPASTLLPVASSLQHPCYNNVLRLFLPVPCTKSIINQKEWHVATKRLEISSPRKPWGGGGVKISWWRRLWIAKGKKIFVPITPKNTPSGYTGNVFLPPLPPTTTTRKPLDLKAKRKGVNFKSIWVPHPSNPPPLSNRESVRSWYVSAVQSPKVYRSETLQICIALKIFHARTYTLHM